MANRKVTVLNPLGYQEVLRNTDTLYVEGPSSFAGASFSDSITGQDGEFDALVKFNAGLESAGGTFTSPVTFQAQVTVNANFLGQGATFSGDVSVANFSAVDGTFTGDISAVAGTFTGDVTLGNSTPSDDLHAASKGYVDKEVSDAIEELTIDYATQTDPGIVRFATGLEVTGGTATNVVVSPADLSSEIDAIVVQDATTTQKGIARLANATEVLTGTNTNTIVVPAYLKQTLNDVNYDVTLDCGEY